MRTHLHLLLCVTAIAASSEAWADRRNPLEGAPAIRNRVELRKLRFEISPDFVVSLNQDYRHAFGPGATLQFHLTDWLAIGVNGAYTFNSDTALEDKVRLQLPNTSTYTYPGPQPTLSIHDQRVLGINALIAAYATITPFAGKFAMFSALFFNYDLYASLGVGMVNYVQNPQCCSYPIVVHPQPGDNPAVGDPNTEDASIFRGFKVGGYFGVGVHMFFNDWIGMQLELRDYIVKANPGGGDTNGDRHLTSDDEGVQNNLFFAVGVTIMLPPHAKITH